MRFGRDMEKLSINEVLVAVDGELLCGSAEVLVDSVSTNSKEIRNGALFVPIKGENFDGHAFIWEAFAAGAVATLISECEVDCMPEGCDKNKIHIKVKDTKVALQQLATYYRQKFDIPVIGITGSVGKTLTKEMIASVLAARFNVHKTNGNLNGQIGLPLTMFGLKRSHEVAVVEMGISEFNEMETLLAIAKPTCAVITNIGVTHIENLHTKENIFNEKLKIAGRLEKKGCLFVNGDDEILHNVPKIGYFRVVTFGLKNNCDFTARNITFEGGKTSFEAVHNEKRQRFEISTIGEHNVYNALVAIAIGHFMGMSSDEIQSGLLQFKNLNMRQNVYNLQDIILIDDSYNANPDSMKSALAVLAQVGQSKRKIAVLADMLELGNMARDLHFEVGYFAASVDIDVLITVGTLAKFIAEAATNSAQKAIATYSFLSKEDAFACLKGLIQPGDCILVKGSRGMHMEEIAKETISLYKKQRM